MNTAEVENSQVTMDDKNRICEEIKHAIIQSSNDIDKLINIDKSLPIPLNAYDNLQTENMHSPHKTQRKRKKYKKNYRDSVKRVKINSLAKDGGSHSCNSSSEDDVYSLIVSNLPDTWNYEQLQKYFDKECGSVDEIQFLKNNDGCTYSLKLIFQSLPKCNKAFNCLKNKEIQGKPLLVAKKDSPDTDSSDTSMSIDNTPWKPDLDVWDIDPSGLYGLTPSFLKSLDITPPIDKWVQVANFRCDKSELRDVMELAGHVLHCTVLTVAGKCAKVMYSHPLEAVQAVSMLNGQTFYGKSLRVTLDSHGDTVVLPKGLASIGPGLGLHGKPLRNIVKHYKRYINKQSSEANTLIFNTPEDNETDSGGITDKTDLKDIDSKPDNVDSFVKQEVRQFKVMNVEELNYNGVDRDDASPDVVQNKTFSPKPVQHSSTVTRPVNPGSGTVITATTDFRPQFGPVGAQQPGPVSGPVFYPTRPRFPVSYVPGPRMGPGPMLVPDPRSVCRPPQQMYPSDSCIVLMSNLPPSTTFPLLWEKISRCGQVVSLEFTTPGCAVVKFRQRAHAHTCYQSFNGFNVEGFVIGVTFI